MQEELREEGIVVSTSDGNAEVQLVENDSCEDCSAKLFCKPQEDSSKYLTIKNSASLIVGDKVSITISGNTLLKASLNLYLYPLILLVASLIAGTKLFNEVSHSEIYSFLISLIVIIIYYVLFFTFSKEREEKESQVIVSKI